MGKSRLEADDRKPAPRTAAKEIREAIQRQETTRRFVVQTRPGYVAFMSIQK